MLQPIQFYYELEPAKNHFYSIFVDVTHRCNMECANCYVPIRDVPDLDVERLYSVLSELPKRAEIRLIGGEPTVRTDLVEIVSKIRQLGHRPTMMTNGLMLARPGYARELFDAGMISIYLSMNGADDDGIYKIMDGMPCAERKLRGWQECVNANMNVNIGAILQRGVNDNVVGKLYDISRKMGGNHILRFRNVGQIGRYTLEKEQNWTFEQMLQLVCAQLDVDPEWARDWNTINGFKERNVVFFPMDPQNKLKTTWIKITDWSPVNSGIPDPGSRRRGRLTQDFKLAPFFEHVKLYENRY